jgi:hypothetical protein
MEPVDAVSRHGGAAVAVSSLVGGREIVES